MKWNQSEIITYCLDTVHELSFTIETENTYFLLILLKPFCYHRQTYLRLSLRYFHQANQPFGRASFIPGRLLPGFMQIYIPSSFVSLSYLSPKAGCCGTWL